MIELELALHFPILVASYRRVTAHGNDILQQRVHTHSLDKLLMPFESLKLLKLILSDTPQNCGTIDCTGDQVTLLWSLTS